MAFVKVNVDVFFYHDFLKGTVGAVLRGDKEKFIAGGLWRINWCASVLTTEALLLRFGLSLTQRTGCNRLSSILI